MADRSPAAGEHAGEQVGYGPGFRIYVAGRAVSIVGDRIALIATVFLVIHLSASNALLLALYYMSRTIPALLGGLVIGVVTDHFDRRRIMVGADLSRAVLVAFVPFLTGVHIALLFPIVIAMNGLSLIFETAAQSALPDVVPEERMLGANSILTAVNQMGDLAYVVGAGLVLTLGLQAPFYIDAASFAFSALTILRLRIPRPVARTSLGPAEILQRIRAGVRYTFNNPFLRWSTIVFAVAPMAGGAGLVLAPLYAQHVLGQSTGLFGPLHSGAFRFSVLEVSLGLGTLAGSIAATRIAKRWSRGYLFGIGVAGTGVADMMLAFTNNIYAATAIMAIAGFFNSLFIIVGITLAQIITATEMRGRMISARMTVVNTALLVGSALGGLALLFISYRGLWLIEGSIIAATSLVVWLRPEIRSQP